MQFPGFLHAFEAKTEKIDEDALIARSEDMCTQIVKERNCNDTAGGKIVAYVNEAQHVKIIRVKGRACSVPPLRLEFVPPCLHDSSDLVACKGSITTSNKFYKDLTYACTSIQEQHSLPKWVTLQVLASDRWGRSARTRLHWLPCRSRRPSGRKAE